MTEMLDSPISGDNPQPDGSGSAFWAGLYTGTLLTIVMIGSLVAANRIPGLERYALERNGAAYILFAMFMLIPVFRFLNRPGRLFSSAMIGWIIFVLAYYLAGIFFHNLFQVLRRPFQAFIEGAIVYGVFSVGSWVGGMLLHARRHSIEPGRRRPSDVVPREH